MEAPSEDVVTEALVDSDYWLPMETPARPQAEPLPLPRSGRLEAIARRALDIVVSAVVLLVTLPLMLVIAAIIKWDSPGPALFFQTRVGRGGRLFRFVKFRTMYADAEERFPDLYEYRYSEEEIRTLYFKKPNDPRHTRFGGWLRRTTLDELPNFINVLLGQMTLVGPRPEIPQMVPYYANEQRKKFSVKPGVTGTAQINGRGLLSFQETVALDCQYVKERSFFVDVRIIVRTLIAVVAGLGAM